MRAVSFIPICGKLKDYLGFTEEKAVLPEENLQDLKAVEEAKREWEMAKRYFNEVTDPALIDFAIFNMEATEKRMVHLIKMLGNKYPQGIWPPEIKCSLEEEEDGNNENVSLTEG